MTLKKQEPYKPVPAFCLKQDIDSIYGKEYNREQLILKIGDFMHIIVIILLILQAVSIYGGITANGFGVWFFDVFLCGLPAALGYFLPTILAIILFVAHGKRKRRKNTVTNKDLAKNPNIEYWTCRDCNTRNRMKVEFCQKCGATKLYSDAKQKTAEPGVQR